MLEKMPENWSSGLPTACGRRGAEPRRKTKRQNGTAQLAQPAQSSRPANAALIHCRSRRGDGRPRGKRPGVVWLGRRGRAFLLRCPRQRSLDSVRVVRVVRARALIRRGSTPAYIKYRKKEVPGFVGAFRQAHTNTRLELPDRARRMRMSKTHTTNEAPKS